MSRERGPNTDSDTPGNAHERPTDYISENTTIATMSRRNTATGLREDTELRKSR